MSKKRCAGCDHLVTQYEDYDKFVLCLTCDREMIEEDERKQEDEVLAAVTCGHRNVWRFESEDLS